MSEWKMKRFWTETGISASKNGWIVTLDERPIKTPAKTLLNVPTQALAQEIANEWQAQEGDIDPNNMPLTRLANSAQDKVAFQHAQVAQIVADYGASDMLCYRADHPEELVARQAAAWDPLLAWAAAQDDIKLQTQAGIMPLAQPAASLRRVSEITAGLTSAVLTGFHDLVSLSGSWVIGYAALLEHATIEDLWSATLVDELWQQDQWGEDEEALEMRAKKRAAFDDAYRFSHLSRQLT